MLVTLTSFSSVPPQNNFLLICPASNLLVLLKIYSTKSSVGAARYVKYGTTSKYMSKSFPRSLLEGFVTAILDTFGRYRASLIDKDYVFCVENLHSQLNLV